MLCLVGVQTVVPTWSMAVSTFQSQFQIFGGGQGSRPPGTCRAVSDFLISYFWSWAGVPPPLSELATREAAWDGGVKFCLSV